MQSFNEKILDMLNRGHSLKDVYKSIEIFKKLGCKNVSWDLLTGLPFENRDNETEWKKEVERWRPEHLSVYSLILEEDSVFARKFGYKEGISPLPSQDDSAETYLSVHETLNKMGYSHYEISSFCQSPKFSCVHSDVYWEGNKPFFGFGMGAASLWAQTRITRPKTIKKYMKFVEGLIIDRMEVEGVLIEKEEGVQEAKSRLIGGLRRENGVEMKGFEKGVKEALWECCKELDDLLEIKEGRIKVKGMRGFLLCDEILARIFVFLEKKGL